MDYLNHLYDRNIKRIKEIDGDTIHKIKTHNQGVCYITAYQVFSGVSVMFNDIHASKFDMVMKEHADGEIAVAGIDPRKKELYEVGRKVGSIFQNPKSQFFAEIVEDEIAFGLENYGVERTHILERTVQALHSINGENLAGKNLFQLSSGERQKIVIIISHDYEFLMEACNKILYLDGHSLKEFSAAQDKEKILEVLQGGEEFP